MSFCFCLSSLFAAQRFNSSAEAQEILGIVAAALAEDLLEQGLRSLKSVASQINAGAILGPHNTKFAVFFLDTLLSLLFKRAPIFSFCLEEEVARLAIESFLDSWDTGVDKAQNVIAYIGPLTERGYIHISKFQSLIEEATEEIRRISRFQLKDADTVIAMPIAELYLILGKHAFYLRHLLDHADALIEQVIFTEIDGGSDVGGSDFSGSDSGGAEDVDRVETNFESGTRETVSSTASGNLQVESQADLQKIILDWGSKVDGAPTAMPSHFVQDPIFQFEQPQCRLYSLYPSLAQAKRLEDLCPPKQVETSIEKSIPVANIWNPELPLIHIFS